MKKSAILDRRLTTEMTFLLFLAQKEPPLAAKHDLAPLLASAVALCRELLLERTQSSMLMKLLRETNQALGNIFLFVPERRSDSAVLDDAAKAWAEDPQFQLAAGRYERGKGVTAAQAAEAIGYVHHALDLARTYDAAIIPHPERWPLFRHVMEHCIWASSAAPIIETPRADEGPNYFGVPGRIPMTLVRYSMPFPFPPGLLRRYEQKDLRDFGSCEWEFLVGQPEEQEEEKAAGRGRPAAGGRDARAPSQSQSGTFDVFLSYNSRNRADVVALAEALKGRGLSVWLDVWELVPGRTWMDELERIVATCRSAAVCVGSDGVGPWEEPEMQALLRRFVAAKRRGEVVPIIPVLLPGAPSEVRLPLFLEAFTWVDFRGGMTDAELDRLQWGITGDRGQ